MTVSISHLASVFFTLLVVVNPFALAPIYMSMTQEATSQEKHIIAVHATLIAVGILIFFLFCGQWILNMIGVGMPAFRIAGGLLLFAVAFAMLFDLNSKSRHSDATTAVEHDNIENIAAFPLAIPLMAGPGAIAAVILLGAQAERHIFNLISAVTAIALVGLVCYGVLAASAPISRVLGKTGEVILTRLMGVILAALAVQFIITGVLTVK